MHEKNVRAIEGIIWEWRRGTTQHEIIFRDCLKCCSVSYSLGFLLSAGVSSNETGLNCSTGADIFLV